MATVQEVQAPQEILDMVARGEAPRSARDGFWFRFADPGVHALVHWAGGPNSPDHDVILHSIETEPGMLRKGLATTLLQAVLHWIDQQDLTTSLVCWPELCDWFSHHGFIRVKTIRDTVEMVRQPRATRGGLILPG